MSCTTICTLAAIERSSACKNKGGIKVAYWTQYGEIDWAAMAADPLQFDPTTQTILQYTMVGAGVFYKLTFERKESFYTAEYTDDNGFYECTITAVVEGGGVGLRNAFAGAIGCCEIVVHVIDNNCDGWVFGAEWDGVTFNVSLRSFRFGRHLQASGQLGTDKARNEYDLIGEQETPPLYSDITQADFEANYL